MIIRKDLPRGHYHINGATTKPDCVHPALLMD